MEQLAEDAPHDSAPEALLLRGHGKAGHIPAQVLRKVIHSLIALQEIVCDSLLDN